MCNYNKEFVEATSKVIACEIQRSIVHRLHGLGLLKPDDASLCSHELRMLQLTVRGIVRQAAHQVELEAISTGAAATSAELPA
ncbi:hypothetical protein P5X00_40130 (plasmid) [Paraburkholderia sp. A2RO-4L]|uniref:hypothetical protein n=1 Tax=Paraburkholderia sp. A2RO-4L TaxID=3028374 RepID=UPI003DA98662